MKNNTSINNKSDDDSNYFLAVMFISLVWIAMMAVSVLLAWLFDGGESFIRFVLLLPLSFGGLYASRSVWKRYS